MTLSKSTPVVALFAGLAVCAASYRMGTRVNAFSVNEIDLANARDSAMSKCAEGITCGYADEPDGWLSFSNGGQGYNLRLPASLEDVSIGRAAPTVVYQPGDGLSYVAPAFRYVPSGWVLGNRVSEGEFARLRNDISTVVTDPEFKKGLIRSVKTDDAGLLAAASAFFGDCGFKSYSLVPSTKAGVYEIEFVSKGQMGECSYVAGEPSQPRGEGIFPGIARYYPEGETAIFVAGYPGCRWTKGSTTECSDSEVFDSIDFLKDINN